MVEKNEGTEERDLAKEEFKEQILEQIQELKNGETKMVVGEMEATKIGDQAILTVRGKNIAIVTGNTIQYNLANFEALKKVLQEEGQTLDDLGLPDLQTEIDKIQKQESEKEQDEEQQDKEETEQEDDGEEIDEEEKDDEKPELEEDKEEVDEKEQKGSEIKRDSSWIEIRSDREIDEMRTFTGAIKKEHPELGEIQRTFIAPDKNNPNSYKIYVQGKQEKMTEVPLETTEGENPMHEKVTVLENDGTNATKKTPIQILKINDRNMIMIFDGGRTTTSVHIANRSDGDNYTSTQISAIDSQNEINDPTEEVKSQVSSAEGQQQEADGQERAYASIRNFEKQNVPDKIDPAKDPKGIEVSEMEDFPAGIFEALKDSLSNAFKDKNIVVSQQAIETMATSIIQGKDFKDSVIEGMQIEEQAGRIPPDSAERVGANISDSITNDEGLEEPEREEDPRLRGKK